MGPHFSEEETKMLLSGFPIEKFPPETVEKLRKNDLIELLDYFPRNLRVFLLN
ncbi:hypothetical protein LCGC14_1811290 [marine sediment metagenome]|uniref:Uncharacterized protein n=1 Tax=marine sediment metagenome TaxID=412755 RepID=A0A0F9JLG4_9ZZZZ